MKKFSRDQKSLVYLVLAVLGLFAIPIALAATMSDESSAESPEAVTTTSKAPATTKAPTTTARVQSSTSNRSSRDTSGFVREIKAVAPIMGSASRSDVIALGDDVCSRYRNGESTVSIVNLYGQLARSSGFPTQEASAFVAFAPVFLCPDVDVR